MENLKSALSRILATIQQVAVAYTDKKITLMEWFSIGTSVIGWIWIFKNLQLIKTDIENSTEALMQKMVEELKVEFDIPQEHLEEMIENALSIIMLIFKLVSKKVPELKLTR